jgi:hypothetical protein
MPTPADVLSGALTRLANDRRRRVTQYANLTPRPGSGTIPQRLLSDIGFLEALQFSYINANPAHVTPPDDDNPRDIRQIVLCAYGLQLDAARFSARNTVIRTVRGPGISGLAPFAALPDVLVSAELTEETYSVQKNDVVRRNMTQRRNGPAYHFLIDRNGGIAVGPALDYRTSVVPARSEHGIFIGLEGALGIARTDFEAGRTDAFFELPYTSLQLLTLAILLAKLFTAYPTIPRTISTPTDGTTPALIYTASTLAGELTHRNFSNGAWKNTEHNGFDYSATDDSALSVSIMNEGNFDLATEIFRPAQAPRAIAARDVARTAIGTVDTAGAQSLFLGAYISLAAPERANDIETQTRRQIFIERLRSTHTEADDTGALAAEVAEGGVSLTPIHPTVTNIEPHTYNYTTGLWGDGEVY